MILNLKSLRMIRTVLLQCQQGTIMMMTTPIALIMLHHTLQVGYGLSPQPSQYYVVVDGFGGATGNYEISISITGGRPMMAMPIIQSEQYGLQRSIK